MRLDPRVINQQINNLLASVPELAEDEVLRADMIEGETELHEFLRVIERKRQETDALVKSLTDVAATLGARIQRFERREQAMRKLAFGLMQTADLRKLELPEATYSIANGQAKVIITDDSALPDILCRIKREPDRTKIKELLKTGAEVRGAVLSNAEAHITIRTR